MARRSTGHTLRAGAAVLAACLGLAQQQAWACAYHAVLGDGFSATYAGSIDVAMALREAIDRGVVREPESLSGQLGLMRASMYVQRLRQTIQPREAGPGNARQVAVLLVESGLWSRLHLDGRGMSVEPHINAPGDEAVLVISEGALAALLDGSVSLQAGREAGLLQAKGSDVQQRALWTTLERGFAAREASS